MHKWDESIAIKYFVRDTISNQVTLHKKQKLKGKLRYSSFLRQTMKVIFIYNIPLLFFYSSY